MRVKNRRILLGFGLLALVSLLGFTPQPVSAALVWSETFNELNEEYWHFVASQIIDGALRPVKQPDQTILDRSAMRAYRDSNVTVGTWKFDITETGEWGEELDVLRVYFISPGWPDLSDYYALYIVHFSDSGGTGYSYNIERWYDSRRTTLDNYLGETVPSVIGTLQHFTITRTGSGLTSVYLNSSLILQATDTSINTSSYFGFYTWDDWAFDNVYVYNTVNNNTTLPLLLAGAAGVAIIAAIVIYSKRR